MDALGCPFIEEACLFSGKKPVPLEFSGKVHGSG